MRSLWALFVATAAGAVLVHAGEWQPISTIPARSHAVALALGWNQGIIVAGGLDGTAAADSSLLPNVLSGVAAGLPGPSAFLSDVLKSTDHGHTWTTVAAGWSARAASAAAMGSGGSIWLYGGLGAEGVLSDMWMCWSDGTHWTPITPTASASVTPGPRAGHAMTSVPIDPNSPSSSRTLVLVGGYSPSAGYNSDVWTATPTATGSVFVWTQASAAAPFGSRLGHQMVSVNGQPYLVGGYMGLGQSVGSLQDDVWKGSADATTWTLVTGLNPWVPRAWFGLAVTISSNSGDALMTDTAFVVAGYGGSAAAINSGQDVPQTNLPSALNLWMYPAPDGLTRYSVSVGSPMVYDSADHSLLLIGGMSADGTISPYVWRYGTDGSVVNNPISGVENTPTDPPQQPPEEQPPVDDSPGRSGLSSGAVGGIIAACSIFSLAVLAAVCCAAHRHNKPLPAAGVAGAAGVVPPKAHIVVVYAHAPALNAAAAKTFGGDYATQQPASAPVLEFHPVQPRHIDERVQYGSHPANQPSPDAARIVVVLPSPRAHSGLQYAPQALA